MVEQFDGVGSHFDVFQGLLASGFVQIWLKDLKCQHELHCVQTIKPFV
jgi:hypothetical protein